ncbi:hypothetical protein ACFOD9_08125 [Novosphingobium bradum]|uniref:Lipoprotein n=1 Tax=Novosphingobium bradum TaxID=1737444 RepID=A0ABV7INL2_9SPHN
MRRGPVLFAAAALALLAACSRGEPGAGSGAAEGAEKIACALGVGARFEAVCALERADRGGEKLLVVHHPDGGFRSFTVLANGAGLAAADGAESARQAIAGDLLEVAVGEDRYRFPFKVKSDGAR